MITGYISFKEAYVLRKECTHWQTYPSSRKSMKGFKDKYIFKVGRTDPPLPGVRRAKKLWSSIPTPVWKLLSVIMVKRDLPCYEWRLRYFPGESFWNLSCKDSWTGRDLQIVAVGGSGTFPSQVFRRCRPTWCRRCRVISYRNYNRK